MSFSAPVLVPLVPASVSAGSAFGLSSVFSVVCEGVCLSIFFDLKRDSVSFSAPVLVPLVPASVSVVSCTKMGPKMGSNLRCRSLISASYFNCSNSMAPLSSAFTSLTSAPKSRSFWTAWSLRDLTANWRGVLPFASRTSISCTPYLISRSVIWLQSLALYQ